MIRDEKLVPAYEALHRVLYWARWLATEAGNKELQDYLDTAEYLPQLMSRDEDMTDVFRGTLGDLAERHPHLKYALQEFDAASPPSSAGTKKAS